MGVVYSTSPHLDSTWKELTGTTAAMCIVLLEIPAFCAISNACKAHVKRRQGDVPWDAVHRTLKLQYQPRRKVYTDDAVIAEPV